MAILKPVLACVVPLCLSVALAACGGGDGPVPNVVGERLDVAQSELEDQGFDVEALGGGTFGIVDESNWTVCESRPAAGETASGSVKLVVDRDCPPSGDTASGSSGETTAEPSSGSDLAAEPEPEPAPAPAAKVTVPNVVGMNHQAAQNRMQAAGLFMLAEEDATGQGRVLVWDRNWVVVSQTPAAGTRVREDRTITLSAKKLGE